MKKLLLIISILYSQFSFAYLQYCSNFGDGVSYSYQSCVNSNFRTIEREFADENLFLQYCTNFGDEVQFAFITCIQSNFRAIDRVIDQALMYCSNFDRTRLGYSFVSCSNGNFSTIERAIPQR